MSVIPIGVTGGIAEGKTTVLRILSEMGYKTLSADDVAKEVLDDPIVWELALQQLGIYGPLDRSALGKLISADPKKRRVLNNIVHPEVLARILEQKPFVVEVPLLVETCLQSLFRRVWVVTCGVDEQRRRLHKRFGNDPRIEGFMSVQVPFSVRRCFADRIIRTDETFDSVVKTVEQISRQTHF